MLHVIIAAHGFIDAEGAHKTANSGRHAVTSIGVQVVSSETGFEKFGSGITFHHCPLARAKHTDGGWALFLQCCLKFFFHDIEGGVPTDWLKLTILVVFSICHA